MLGIGMDFDDQAISPGRNPGPRDGGNIIRVASAVAGVENDGQVRKVFEDRNGVDIGGIARGGFKGADAALAQHHLLVAPARIYSADISSSSMVAKGRA